MAHDAQIIGSGITTVFDSLCVGATIKNPERREILGPMIDALETAQAAGMLRAEHLVHLRCEITDPDTAPLAEEKYRPRHRADDLGDGASAGTPAEQEYQSLYRTPDGR
ncbi:hypothetical protein QW131_12405 [Roseibium salinum]|nr:hypothetical protein [Roseibium salinum]